MNVDGSDVRRLTHTLGYDGGAWFSPDGKKIVYRAYHPTDSGRSGRLQGALGAAHRAADQDGNLDHERRRL